MVLKQKAKQKEIINNVFKILDEAVLQYANEDYIKAAENLSLAHKIFLAKKDIPNVSLCLSLLGLIKYIINPENYFKSLYLLEDSKFLAQNCGQKAIIAINKFAFGQIYYMENKYNEALFYLTYCCSELKDYPILYIKVNELLALTYIKLQNTKMAYACIEKAAQIKSKEIPEKLYKEIKKLYDNFVNSNSSIPNKSGSESSADKNQNTTLLNALSEIARTVNAESNLDKLLITIAEQTKIVLNADRCSVFLYDKDKNELWSKVALGMESEEIRFSADKGFAGYAVKTGETIRIKDAYKDSRFNKEIDKHTGYKTYNMLCMPIRNIKFEIIGAFQVLNKKDGEFTPDDEEILLAIGTNAGIAIENNLLFNIQQQMLKEQKEIFDGFIDTLAASIDARDKITLGHSNRVRLYSELISNKLGLNSDITQIISKAAMLHDIGKIGIRDAVLQKKGALTKEEYEHIKEHVKITYDILRKTNINSSFTEITEIAASHHEKYDGSGYFRGLKGEEIPLGGRILAVSDVFDAITSVRHYRNRMPIYDALKIMTDGKNKHFDGKIVDTFLSLPCDVIIDILISEYKMTLKEKDRKILSAITLKQFADILQKEKPTQKEKNVTEIFNRYYVR